MLTNQVEIKTFSLIAAITKIMEIIMFFWVQIKIGWKERKIYSLKPIKIKSKETEIQLYRQTETMSEDMETLSQDDLLDLLYLSL